jgi:hypothetical protein
MVLLLARGQTPSAFGLLAEYDCMYRIKAAVLLKNSKDLITSVVVHC